MGYSPEFLRGVLSLIGLIATAVLAVAGVNEVFGLGLWDDGYPGSGGFAPFALSLLALIAVCWAIGVLVDRFYG